MDRRVGVLLLDFDLLRLLFAQGDEGAVHIDLHGLPCEGTPFDLQVFSGNDAEGVEAMAEFGIGMEPRDYGAVAFAQFGQPHHNAPWVKIRVT